MFQPLKGPLWDESAANGLLNAAEVVFGMIMLDLHRGQVYLQCAMLFTNNGGGGT